MVGRTGGGAVEEGYKVREKYNDRHASRVCI